MSSETYVEELTNPDVHRFIAGRFFLTHKVMRSHWMSDLVSSFPLFCADVVAIFFAWVLSRCCGLFLLGDIVAPGFGSLLIILVLYPLMMQFQGLYPGILVSPADELQRIYLAAAFAFTGFLVSSFIYRDCSLFHVWIRLVNFLLLFGCGAISRMTARGLLSHSHWWKQEAAIVGDERDREQVVAWLKSNGQFGAKASNGVSTAGNAILATQKRRDDASIFRFRNLWHVEFYGSKPHVTRHQKNYLLSPIHTIAKRGFDLLVILFAAPIVVPVMFVLGILVKLSSPGPIFYSQQRVGKDARPFKAWKFRSMVPNAAEVLEQHLQSNDALRQEWERDHKLKQDPRVTVVGRIMRKTSLDELPQLFNVLCGEMSLVGPRPIVVKEVEKYADRYICYQSVAPGITGLWQINGRNNTTYDERTAFDEDYACNWSVWYDLYILLRTVKTVLRCEGAY